MHFIFREWYYLYYPYPDLRAQTYWGMGLRLGGFLDHREKFGYIVPGFLLGREYMTRNNAKQFIQVAVGPGGLTTKGFKYWASISLAFGYSF